MTKHLIHCHIVLQLAVNLNSHYCNTCSISVAELHLTSHPIKVTVGGVAPMIH